jgi:hypothetical protein
LVCLTNSILVFEGPQGPATASVGAAAGEGCDATQGARERLTCRSRT